MLNRWHAGELSFAHLDCGFLTGQQLPTMSVFWSLQLLSAAWESGLCDTAPTECAQPLGVTLAAFSHMLGGYREDRARLLSVKG